MKFIISIFRIFYWSFSKIHLSAMECSRFIDSYRHSSSLYMVIYFHDIILFHTDIPKAKSFGYACQALLNMEKPERFELESQRHGFLDLSNVNGLYCVVEDEKRNNSQEELQSVDCRLRVKDDRYANGS